MPWTVADVEGFKKGLTDAQKKVWVKVANDALTRCKADGGSDEKCEGSAIKQANSVAGKIDEADSLMDGLRSAMRSIFDIFSGNSEDDINAALEEATKTEDGKAFPSSDYAYVPDADKPSTWKLRLTATPGGSPDAGIVGAAAAALGPGFRGQKVEIPSSDLPAVKAKVRAAWKKANPDKEAEDMPSGIKESADLEETELIGDYIELVEKVGKDGTVPIKIIQPGWGSSGYYPEAVLRKAAPIYHEGLQMYWDHPTASEDRDRPERSLNDLAGVLKTGGRYDPSGVAGPGIYADAQIFERFRGLVQEMAPHIGMSHRAEGRRVKGEAEGRKGLIVEEIKAAHSVDFVTAPGAGGQVLSIFESVRNQDKEANEAMNEVEKKQYEDQITNLTKQATTLTEQLLARNKEVESLTGERDKLLETMLLVEAKTLVTAELKDASIPDVTKERLVEQLSRSPVIKDGKLDAEATKARVQEAIKAEAEYIAKVTGSGAIKGMGESQQPDEDKEGRARFKEAMKTSFIREGHSEADAERMAETAATGRR